MRKSNYDGDSNREENKEKEKLWIKDYRVVDENK
jgi:hypothetical protein